MEDDQREGEGERKGRIEAGGRVKKEKRLNLTQGDDEKKQERESEFETTRTKNDSSVNFGYSRASLLPSCMEDHFKLFFFNFMIHIFNRFKGMKNSMHVAVLAFKPEGTCCVE